MTDPISVYFSEVPHVFKDENVQYRVAAFLTYMQRVIEDGEDFPFYVVLNAHPDQCSLHVVSDAHKTYLSFPELLLLDAHVRSSSSFAVATLKELLEKCNVAVYYQVPSTVYSQSGFMLGYYTLCNVGILTDRGFKPFEAFLSGTGTFTGSIVEYLHAGIEDGQVSPTLLSLTYLYRLGVNENHISLYTRILKGNIFDPSEFYELTIAREKSKVTVEGELAPGFIWTALHNMSSTANNKTNARGNFLYQRYKGLSAEFSKMLTSPENIADTSNHDAYEFLLLFVDYLIAISKLDFNAKAIPEIFREHWLAFLNAE